MKGLERVNCSEFETRPPGHFPQEIRWPFPGKNRRNVKNGPEASRGEAKCQRGDVFQIPSVFSRECGRISGRKWRPIGNSCEPFSSTEHLTDIINFRCLPLYKDRCFLHQKYVVEGLSIAQISSQIVSSKAAVRDNLVRFGIPLREAHLPHGRPAQPKFGQKFRDGKAVPHMAEKKVIEAVMEMRKQNLSLRQIARFLTKVGVPTKRRGVSWHPEMVKRLLSSVEQDTMGS